MVAALFAGACNLLPGLTYPSDSTSTSSTSTTFSGSLSPQGAPVLFTFTAGTAPVAGHSALSTLDNVRDRSGPGHSQRHNGVHAHELHDVCGRLVHLVDFSR